MRKRDLGRLTAYAALAIVPVMMSATAGAQTPAPVAAPAPPFPQMPPSLVPVYKVDLMTPEGSAVFGAQWRSMEAKIVEGPAIPDAMPGYKTSYDIQPHAGVFGFDDSSWPVIGAKGLGAKRGGGRVSFLWYRANLTIPAKIGDFETAGATAVLTIYVDDYAEIWVNGQVARRTGYPSPATIQGFNIPNHVVLGDPVKPGDKFQVAVFGINGPISVVPMNFVWFREAKLEFFR